MKSSPTANVYWLPPFRGAAILFAFSYRLTRKRVRKLLETHLVTGDVLLKLVPYIFLNRLFIASYRIYIVPTAPEVPVPVLVLEICMTIENHQTTLALKVAHKLRNTILRRDCYIKVDMIGHCRCFDNLNALSGTQCTDNLTNVCRNLAVDNLPAVFGCKNIVYNCKYNIYVLYYYYARWRI